MTDLNIRPDRGTQVTLAVGRVLLACLVLVAWLAAIEGWAVFEVSGAYSARDLSAISPLATRWADFTEGEFFGYFLPILTICLPVLFVTWHWRSRKRLERHISFERTRWSTLWWWLIPIANIWMPFVVAAETLRSARPDPEEGGWSVGQIRFLTITWAAAFWAGRGGMRAAAGAFDDLEGNPVTALRLYTGAALVFAASAVACVVFVLAVSKGLSELPQRGPLAGSAEALRTERTEATDGITSDARLTDLSRNSDPTVRAGVAVNESTPDAVVEALAMDRNPTVARLARDTLRKRTDA